tara:strand:+ start:1180 stop:1926 length:747 start_codon:yes stop_codon:yes gene_type:complete
MFKKYSEYYDYIYKDKNYKKESKYISKLLKLNKKDSVLDIGCGTANHAIYLSRKVKFLVGIDKSKSMVSIAKKKVLKKKLNNKILIILNDITKKNINFNFNKAIMMFHALCYLNKDNEIKNFFKFTSKMLPKNGILICDYWNKDAVNKYGLKSTKKIIKEKDRKIIRFGKPLKSKIKKIKKIKFTIKYFYKNKKIKEFSEIHNMRPFSKKDILKYSNKYFYLYKNCKYYNQKPATNKDWTSITILKKK